MGDVPQQLGGGRYRVVGVLGEGAQATTFDAVEAGEGRTVAIKRFRVHGAGSWKEVELAEREATVLASLSHPLLPRYVEHFEEHGELFLVTEKIEGESLSSLRRRGVAFDEADVTRLLCDAAEALGYLHGRTPPIVHRDLKPSNVIRREDGSFAFIDFGAVRDRMKPEGGSTVVGTFGYMAPEQFQGRAMPASDVYAMGATALALLTRSEPEELPHRGLGIDVQAALEGFRVSASLTEALSAMLAPIPEERAQAIAPLLGPAPEAPARTKRRAATRQSKTRGEGSAGSTKDKASARTAKSGKPHQGGSIPCPNRACKRGLAGDGVCTWCGGWGEVERTPRGWKFRCPNECVGGVAGGSVCVKCGGWGEIEVTQAGKRPPQEKKANVMVSGTAYEPKTGVMVSGTAYEPPKPAPAPPKDTSAQTAPAKPQEGPPLLWKEAAACIMACSLLRWGQLDGHPWLRACLWIYIVTAGLAIVVTTVDALLTRRRARMNGTTKREVEGPTHRVRVGTTAPGGARIAAVTAARDRDETEESDTEEEASAERGAIRRTVRG